MRKWIRRALILFFTAMLIFSGWQLWKILSAYYEGQSSYSSLEQFVSFAETEPPAPTASSPAASTEDSTAVAEVPAPAWPQVDFAQLSEINPEVIGWIYIEDTKINYPVVQGTDNQYYLKHLFDGSYNSSGCIFMDAACAPDFSDQHSIVYGHHMKDKSMFSGLVSYKDQKFYDEHSVALLVTPSASYKIRFFSGYVSDTGGNAWALNLNGEEYTSWLNDIRQKSCFTSDYVPTSEDRIVTLSTCINEFDSAKFVLHGYISEVIENNTSMD